MSKPEGGRERDKEIRRDRNRSARGKNSSSSAGPWKNPISPLSRCSALFLARAYIYASARFRDVYKSPGDSAYIYIHARGLVIPAVRMSRGRPRCDPSGWMNEEIEGRFSPCRLAYAREEAEREGEKERRRAKGRD